MRNLVIVETVSESRGSDVVRQFLAKAQLIRPEIVSNIIETNR